MERSDGHQQAGPLGWSVQQRELVIAHLPSLLGAALAYCGRHRRAERLVEETLRTAAREAPDEDQPLTWLHTHLWARFLDLGDEPDHTGPASGHQPPHDDPGTLPAAITALPPAARAAVHLVDVEGLSYAQLARVLGMTTQEAMAVLHAARRQLIPTVTSHTG
ncbi:MAG: RNA polymerase sigma factor [Nitriliruptoraceae bacterium]